MDKSWVNLHRLSTEYEAGLNRFLDKAFEQYAIDSKILCPCTKCQNRFRKNRRVTYLHLKVDGMTPWYKVAEQWIYHGEERDPMVHAPSSSNVTAHESEVSDINEMNQCVDDIMHQIDNNDDQPSSTHINNNNDVSPQAEKFFKLVEDANTDLYPGCTTFKKLEFIVELYQTKALYGWSDKSFSTLLEIIKRALPEGETLPDTFYQTKKMISELGLGYEKIDVCPNDCMLYWPKGSPSFEAENCSYCQISRWADPVKKVSAKVFRYFPLIPRLQRLFMSIHTAKHMTWHDLDRTKDGVLRHPADSQCWKHLDQLYPDFANDNRNIRLGLASDGFNPFGIMSSCHSTWPVVLTIYNLPPWMCMKQPYLLMSSLIAGPRGPGNDIDIYLQPLIEELKELWNAGVSTYDVSTNQTFTLRAALLWTINDFPAYSNLSGWSTKGKLACPQCNLETESEWLKNGNKQCYMCHRRFLSPCHEYRGECVPFNGKTQFSPAPLPPTGAQCLTQLEGLQFSAGKGDSSLRFRKGITGPWKKKSIFFSLPYWKHNLLRHNLDVMHIEKNVCESVVGTLLGIEGKSKDSQKAREDLQHMGIKQHLWPIIVEGRTRIPPADYTLTSRQKQQFCSVLANLRLPDGYAGNVARCVSVDKKKISGWKSHDCHVVMQELLPLAMRSVLPRHVMSVLHELSKFFNGLCSKTSSREMFEELSRKIAITLCDLEKIFPPAFFDIMIHLPIHLAYEASIAGPVHYRWMYPIERYLRTLKGYVRNKSRPEGCIAEGYVVEECLSFCAMYLEGVETKRSRPGRNTTPLGRNVIGGFAIFSTSGKRLGKCELFEVDGNVCYNAHKYVLFNCEEVRPFLTEQFLELKRNNRRKTLIELERMQNDTFVFWLRGKVITMLAENPNSVHEDLRSLAIGPDTLARKYKRYVVNEFRFRTKECDMNTMSQNSGVFLSAKTSSYCSITDSNPLGENVDYYGVLTNIVELDYRGGRKVVLFGCDWVDVLGTTMGIRVDNNGFTLVNLNRILPTEDTFILASQAVQVFYVEDPNDEQWHVVLKTRPRDLYDMN